MGRNSTTEKLPVVNFTIKTNLFVLTEHTLFGTKLVVRNPKNDKKVVVRVIDRGPFRKGRVIDLSYIAAKELGIINHGIAPVEVYSFENWLENFRKHLPDSALLGISQILR